MFPQENEYKSLLPQNAYGSPNFDKVACTKSLTGVKCKVYIIQPWGDINRTVWYVDQFSGPEWFVRLV